MFKTWYITRKSEALIEVDKITYDNKIDIKHGILWFNFYPLNEYDGIQAYKVSLEEALRIIKTNGWIEANDDYVVKSLLSSKE